MHLPSVAQASYSLPTEFSVVVHAIVYIPEIMGKSEKINEEKRILCCNNLTFLVVGTRRFP